MRGTHSSRRSASRVTRSRAAVGLVAFGTLVAGTLAASAGSASDAPPPSTPASSATLQVTEADSVRILVVYHSLTGHTKELARAAADGARAVSGAAVLLKRVDEVTEADLRATHGLIVGSPTHWANVSAEVKTFVDRWPDMVDKVGGALATGGGAGGGHEQAILSLVAAMLNHGMVVVGPVFEEDGFRYGWMGAGAVTGFGEPALNEQELEGARRLGRRVAEAARRYHADAAPREAGRPLE